MSDGESQKVRCGKPGAYELVSVRLAEMVAPERRQTFSSQSTKSFSDLCFGVQARIRVTATDRYKRSVGRVEGKGVDASAEQIRTGMAWFFAPSAKVELFSTHPLG